MRSGRDSYSFGRPTRPLTWVGRWLRGAAWSCGLRGKRLVSDSHPAVQVSTGDVGSDSAYALTAS
jgi:hypothetical protein